LSRATANSPENRRSTRIEGYAVAEAQVLAIDEAHNYLNRDSNRSKAVRQSKADHVLLFTATPINQGAADLLTLVDLLGADNFEDATLEILDQLDRRSNAGGALNRDQLHLLRREIQRFTVRRTKTMLNALVEENPEAYRHPDSGRICRYPEHQVRTYATGETAQDSQIATQVRATAGQLVGVTLLGRLLRVPIGLRREYTDEQWLNLRLAAAGGLALHNVVSAMRSSRAALLEHLVGTREAARRSGIPNLAKAAGTGDMLSRLHRAADSGLPINELTCPMPDWLIDREAWRSQCEHEAALYRRIFDLAIELSTARERAKADVLSELSDRHNLVIAFDHHPITLAAIKPLIDAPDVTITIATGGDDHGRKKVAEEFQRDSDGRGIALCSDAMSEGLNLQGASTVVHLDLPTTLRVAEQRVGRVDRMDSPYDVIEACWPQEGGAFAIRSDELLHARAAESASLLGANLPIPTAAVTHEVTVVEHAEHLEQLRGVAWDGIQDALAPVRDFVTGPRALVPPDIYATYIDVEHRVIAHVSPVTSRTPWAFIAVSSRLGGAPRWMLLEGDDLRITIGLDAVADRLRYYLSEDPPPREHDDASQNWLDRFLNAAERSEGDLLPRRMQRALDQMTRMTQAWSKDAVRQSDYDAAERWGRLHALASPGSDDERADAHEVAERWLHLVRPLLDDSRRMRHARYTRLRDIDKRLASEPLDLGEVEAAFTGVSVMEPFTHRISACIVGVPHPDQG